MLAACLAAFSCSRFQSKAGVERIAVLRFENLSSDPSLDWMSRAFPEIIARELAGVPDVHTISPERLHGADGSFGRRPPDAPGVSAERTLALAAGASRLGYGEFWLESNHLQARLTLEDLPAGKTTVLAASAPAGGVLATAGALARAMDGRAAAYGTQNAAAMKAFVEGLEMVDPAGAAQRFEEALAADPNFGPPYNLLAQSKLQQRDAAGALGLLQQAVARGNRIPDLDRVQIAVSFATLRGDFAARQQALNAWSRLTPNDPAVWRAIGQAAMNSHDYARSVQSYQRAVALQPDDASLLNQLGYAAAYAGDLKTATSALERYAALRPGDPNPLDSLGDAHFLLGSLREAENFYLQAAKKDPTFEGGADLRKAAMARLTSGDIAGAAALHQQFIDRRVQARDPLVGYYQADWAWLRGSRQEALGLLEAFARGIEDPALRQVASEAYSELAVWNVVLGRRADASPFAADAVRLAGPASADVAFMAQFLAQPSVSPQEWIARAEHAFPQAVQKPVRDLAVAYALLTDRHFTAAARVLQAAYDSGAPAPDEGLAVLLAWCDLETGKQGEAAGLLRFNPISSGSGVRPFRVFYFPRLFYLRGRVAAVAADANHAREQFQLFRRLSGSTPLVWGEEARAR